MTVFLLGREPYFPDPAYAEPDGLLAVGGDLCLERLVAAYGSGIFPWYGPDTPIMWWSPDPRPVLFPDELYLARSLRKCLRKEPFRITVDQDFEAVLGGCAKTPRPQGEGTWLISEMIEAYCNLHEAGLAHSVEAWDEGGRLVGGIYGVALGRVFFAESMFYRTPNASKCCFQALVRLLGHWRFRLMDCQQTTPHVLRFGAREIPRSQFLARLRRAVFEPGVRGKWAFPSDFTPYPCL